MRCCSRVMGYLKGITIMPRTKKSTPITAAKTETAAKPVAKAAAKAAEIKAEEVKAVAAPAEAPKAEPKKTAPAKTAAKAAAKTATKKTSAKKSAPKAAPAKAAPEKKRGGRKPKPVTVDDIVAKISKRIDKAAAKSIAADGKAAVDIKLYGPFEAHMYIEIKDGSVTVAPYDYIENDLVAAISVENALAIADGKLTVKEAVENGALYVAGNVQFALKFAKLFG